MDPKTAPLYGVLIPALITLAFVAAAWRPWKRAGVPTGGWGSALGVSLGYIAADILIRGWHGLLPPGGGLLHPHIALATALIAAPLTFSRKLWAWLPTMSVLSLASSAAILRAAINADARAAIPYVAIAGAVGLALWLCIFLAARRSTGARVPLMLWAAAAGSALILLQSGNLALAQMSGALAACMGVFILLGWLRPQIPAVLGATPVFAMVMLGLLIAGRGFAEPWKNTDRALILAAAAIASPALTLLPPLHRLKPWAGTLVGVLCTAAISAAGLYLTTDGFDFSGFR
jgi:hypothetical protein